MKTANAVPSLAWPLASLEAALWAFHDASDFREAVLRAVNLGDDADTTGAVCGQLAGAFWGEQGIPQEWPIALARKDMIERALSALGLAHQGAKVVRHDRTQDLRDDRTDES